MLLKQLFGGTNFKIASYEALEDEFIEVFLHDE